MKFNVRLKTILLSIFGLFILFLIGTVLFFNAQPVDKRVTTPVESDYSVRDDGFKLESGIVSGRNWVDGNNIEVLTRGKDIFEAMHEDISASQKSITKETFNFFGDDVGMPMAEALAGAAERGLNVHFLMDYIGSVPAGQEKFDRMENSGVEVVRWRKPAWYQLSRFNHRTHRKLLVVDGKVAYTGGANTADNWLPDIDDGGYKDYHFRITGPVVSEIQGAFIENWILSEGTLLLGEGYFSRQDTTGTLSMQVSSGHPREGEVKLRKMLLHALASARETVRIGSAYFFPDEGFLEALARTSGRGVQVQILVPGEKIDQNYVRLASQSQWGTLLEAGIEIYEYQPAMYHAKLMIIDDYFVTVGSTNFDNRSFRLNDETNVNILGSEFGEKMTEFFEEDLRDSKLITYEDWADRSFLDIAAGWVIARVIGSYL
ncbi:MAG: phosphatidylserine/phosphatidylglycerophosphate/cardiolipin synthase family protein [Balneolaceae bacterium]|nr:phosphatidylserine/phosphatidylglycerophosphate/cardiolipin synthase family protein [Balneolaceae bacterium]